MSTTTVAPPAKHVKLADDQQAMIHNGALLIQHRAALVTGMDLSDAIKLAKLVLARAEYAGIDVSDAAYDIRQMGESAPDSDDYPPKFRN